MLICEIMMLENGCPLALARLGEALEVTSIVVGLFGATGVTIGAWLSFFSSGAIGGVVSACKR